ncbi:NEQ243 [Nanoarchaeum equitans Kin4-M]|uniref:NEQ243 n=1 Tax=Nanoarchaeum equitans (strain Kin4-M) TaxID=228908 RepID=Q74MR4_NANEQ|nr:NEQ243 [Nanoarchaeum equitans Kin4-M]
MYELIFSPQYINKDKKILIPLGFFFVILSYIIQTYLDIDLFRSRVSLYFILTLLISQITTKLFEMFEFEEEIKELKIRDFLEIYILLSIGILLGFLVIPQNFSISFSPTGIEYILVNNLKLAYTFFVLSFLFGIGSEFLLAYNLDILAYAIKQKPILLPLAMLEFAGFLLFSLAGGILSISIIRNSLNKYILIDIAKILLFGTAILITSYIIELSMIYFL